MIRVLQICPFEIPAQPQSGGAIRIAETAKAYEALGSQVDRCTVVPRKKAEKGPLDVHLTWLDRVWRTHLGKPGNLGPIRQMWALRRSRRLLQQLLDKVTHPYDVVHVEHPWNFELAQGLIAAQNLRRAVLVYGSHNIESELLESVWRSNGQWNHNAKKLAADIQSQEAHCAKTADVCWAVSEADRSKLEAWGAQRAIHAPNGCRTLPDKRDMAGVPATAYALFIGAQYKPNVDGFLDWLGTDLTELPDGTQIVVAGSVCQALQDIPALQPDIQAGRLLLLGRVDSALLDQLIKHSHAILLPINAGGGTNLKTAEAIVSRRPIIATSMSFRGFEAWSHGPGIHVCQSPNQFKAQVFETLGQARVDDSARPDEAKLTWRHALLPAAATVLSCVTNASEKQN